MYLKAKHQTGDWLGHQVTHPHGVAQNQIPLQLGDLLWVDSFIREAPETGIDPIDRGINSFQFSIQIFPAFNDPGFCIFR